MSSSSASSLSSTSTSSTLSTTTSFSLPSQTATLSALASKSKRTPSSRSTTSTSTVSSSTQKGVTRDAESIPTRPSSQSTGQGPSPTSGSRKIKPAEKKLEPGRDGGGFGEAGTKVSRSAPARMAYQPPPPPLQKPLPSHKDPPSFDLPKPADRHPRTRSFGSANAFSAPSDNPYLSQLLSASLTLDDAPAPAESPASVASNSSPPFLTVGGARRIAGAASSPAISPIQSSTSLSKSPTILSILSAPGELRGGIVGSLTSSISRLSSPSLSDRSTVTSPDEEGMLASLRRRASHQLPGQPAPQRPAATPASDLFEFEEGRGGGQAGASADSLEGYDLDAE